jgi:hypothetical protein
MKKILLLAALFLNSSLLFAQVIQKNKRILGGTVNGGYNQSQADTLASSKPSIKGSNGYINLSPSFGKAVKQNVVFGYLVSLGYSYSKSEDLRLNDTGKTNGYTVGGGVFLERYFPLSKSLSFSGSLPLQLYYSWSENKLYQNGTLSGTSKDKYYGVSIGLYPSLNYLLSKKFILQLTLNNFVSLGYRHSTNESEQPNTSSRSQESSSFGFNTRVNESTRLSDLSFAFRYIF